MIRALIFVIFIFNPIVALSSVSSSIDKMDIKIKKINEIGIKENERNNKVLNLNIIQLIELKRQNFFNTQYNNLLLYYYKIDSIIKDN